MIDFEKNSMYLISVKLGYYGEILRRAAVCLEQKTDMSDELTNMIIDAGKDFQDLKEKLNIVDQRE